MFFLTLFYTPKRTAPSFGAVARATGPGCHRSKAAFPLPSLLKKPDWTRRPPRSSPGSDLWGQLKRGTQSITNCVPRFRLSKNLWESSRGPRPARIIIVPSGVHGGRGAIFSEENLIFRRENRFIADFATGIRRIQAKSGRGGRGGGACSLGHKRVKNYFDTLSRPEPSGRLASFTAFCPARAECWRPARRSGPDNPDRHSEDS